MKLWPRSLTARILLIEVIAIGVASIVLPLGAAALLRDAANAEQQRLLTTQSDRIAHYLVMRSAIVEVRLPPNFARVFANSDDGRGFLVLDKLGNVYARSSGSPAVPLAAIPRERNAKLFRARSFVALSKPVRINGKPLWIVVSQNEAYPGAIVDDVSHHFLWQFNIVLIATLALLPLINALVFRELVRVVRRASEQAAAVGPATLGQRLDDTDMPTELKGLVLATNRLIDRLELSLSRQRQFVADLTHELKTPLATLRIQLDALDDGGAKRKIADTIDRLAHVTSQMRDLAELETLGQAARVPVDLNNLAGQIVAELAPVVYGEAHRIEFQRSSNPTIVSGSKLLIELALRNLVMNAIQHTPPETLITVMVEEPGQLTVADTGPGLKQDQQFVVTRRFWRADHHRSDTAGLGLSIVERICEVHGATFDIGITPMQGARFSIIFNEP